MKVSTAFYNIADDINRGFVKILNTNEFEINKINELIDNFITIYTKIRTKLNFEELSNYLSNKRLLEEVNIKHKIFSIDNKKSKKKEIVKNNVLLSINKLMKVIAFYNNFIKDNEIIS